MTNKCTWLGPNSLVETCSQPSLDAFSYCKHHYPLVYREGTAQRRRLRERYSAEAIWDIENAFNEAVAELEAEGAI